MFSAIFAVRPAGGSLPRTVSPIVTVPWDPGKPASWPPGPGDQGAFPEQPDGKTGAADAML